MPNTTPKGHPPRESGRDPGSGCVVVLNGVPRSGKSSIARAVQAADDHLWLNLGVDAFAGIIPSHLVPGIGLRPGAHRPDVTPHILDLYRTLFRGVASMATTGTNIIVDVGLHDAHRSPFSVDEIRLEELRQTPSLFIGVRCSQSTIIARRLATGMPIPEIDILRAWEVEVHRNKVYDLEFDTDRNRPDVIATTILKSVYSSGAGEAMRSREEMR